MSICLRKIAVIIIAFFTSAPGANALENELNDFPNLQKIINDGGKHDRESQKEGAFWRDRYRGWFFYESMKSEDGKKKKEEENSGSSLYINWSEYKKLPAKDMRAVINELKELAITHSTENNVQNYMIAQKIATNKAAGFMTVWQKVLKDHPALDETVKQPGSQYANFNVKTLEKKTTDETIAKLAKDTNYGIVLFYSKENYYSGIQIPVFERFIESAHWQTHMEVDVGEYPESAAEYGIETLPEIWLVEKGGSKARVSAGMRTADVIIRGIVTAYEKITGQKILPEPFRYADNNSIIDVVTVENN